MKLLVISHNPVSRYNAMGKTLASFLREFRPDEVCQLYIYPGYPREGVCGSFYRITDREVLTSWLFPGKPGAPVEAEKIGQDCPGYHSKADHLLYKNARNKAPLRRLIREILWGGCFWLHPGLRSWLEQEKPDCILAAGGDGMFLYTIARTLSREYRLPLAFYICDEYYFLAPQKGALAKLRQKLLKRKMEQVFSDTDHLVVISRELQARYAGHFALPVTTIMTGSSFPIAPEPKQQDKITTLVYMGNLDYGRYHALAAVGDALDRINGQLNTRFRLEVYSASDDSRIRKSLAGIQSTVLCGFVQGQALREVWERADMFVHVEDFSAHNRELVRHSVSTKIGDCLASGKPLFAYGPEDVASIRHLRENHCAFVADRKETLESELRRALLEPQTRWEMAQRGLMAARNHHDPVVNSRRFYNLMQQLREETV